LVVVISATEAHNQENVRRSIDESLGDLDAIFTLAKENGTQVIGAVAVSFGCPYQGDVPEKDVFRVVEAYMSRGAASVILADTTGMTTPTRVEQMVLKFRDRFPGVEFILHFHNNRGTAMANLLTALMAGATTFDTALGGIGGCPYVPQAAGNLPTEDVVFMLEDMGVCTGIDLKAIIGAAHLLEKILGYSLPGQVMKSGPRDPKLAAKICGVY
jgi:hydroxymethylglutaryl-CoA lyase